MAGASSRGARATARRRGGLRRLEHDASATLIEHLEELRIRMFLCLGAMAAIFVVAFLEHHRLVTLLAAPLPESAGRPVTFGVAEPFLLSMRLSLWAACAASLPLLLWQGWSYAAPAFAPDAQRSVGVFSLISTLLFTAGITFGYLVALPQCLSFLVGYDSQLYDTQLRAQEYYAFVMMVVVAIGAVFELPIVLLGLVRFRITTTGQLRRNRRMGYAALCGIAVLLPGVDPVLTALELAPLVVLYEGTLLVAGVLERRWNRQRQQRAVERCVTPRGAVAAASSSSDAA